MARERRSATIRPHDGLDRSPSVPEASRRRDGGALNGAARRPPRGGRRRSSRGRRRPVGNRDAVCLAIGSGREAAVGLRLRSPHRAGSPDLRVPPGAGHGMEGLERDADLDVQAPLGREVPRGLGRAHGRGRQVDRRAELQARRAGRLGLLLPQQPRADRDARQADRRDALQKSPVDRAVALHTVRWLPERDVQEVHGDGRRSEGGDASDRHRALSPRRRQAGRLPPLRGGARPLAQDARVPRAGDPPDPGAGDASGRAARRGNRHRPGLR